MYSQRRDQTTRIQRWRRHRNQSRKRLVAEAAHRQGALFPRAGLRQVRTCAEHQKQHGCRKSLRHIIPPYQFHADHIARGADAGQSYVSKKSGKLASFRLRVADMQRSLAVRENFTMDVCNCENVCGIYRQRGARLRRAEWQGAIRKFYIVYWYADGLSHLDA